MRHTLFFDGGYRAGTKIAGSGAVLKLNSTIVGTANYKFQQRATSNQAEYKGLIIGLELARRMNVSELDIYGDSLLVVSQINKTWKINKPHLKVLNNEAHTLLCQFTYWSISHVPRDQNSDADKMANLAMDG